jgi:hypothetical protein
MGARQAVLQTPPGSSYPQWLPFYKQSSPITPLFATLTAPAPLTPVFATLTKTPGVYSLSSHSETHHSPLVTLHFPLRKTHAFDAPSAFSHFGALCFQQLAHSSAIRWGWGWYPSPGSDRPDRRQIRRCGFLSPLCAFNPSASPRIKSSGASWALETVPLSLLTAFRLHGILFVSGLT